MRAEQLLSQHGEKLVLVVACIFCIWWVWSTVGDESTRSELGPEDINGRIARIDEVVADPPKPNFEAPPDLLADLRRRLGATPQVIALPQYLHEHPTPGGMIAGNFLSAMAFVLGRPSISVRDQIGSLQVDVTLPAPRLTGQRRVIDDPAIIPTLGAPWQRQVPEREGPRNVSNTAAHLGVIIEMRVGEGPWQPATAPRLGRGGFLPLEAFTGGRTTLQLQGVEPWVRYSFRASLVARASAVPADGVPVYDSEVIVLAQPLPELSDPSTEQLKADFAAGKLSELQAERVDPASLPDGLLPRSAATQSLFRSRPSEAAAVSATSAIRLALERVSPDPMGGEGFTATIIAVRLLKAADGAVAGWTEPVKFSVKNGELVGNDSVVLFDPVAQARRAFDFSTPFRVRTARRGVERTAYYQVRLDRGIEGTRLVVETRTRNTDVIELVNEVTGGTIEFSKLERLPRVIRPDPIFPDLPREGYDESKAFLEEPLTFRSPSLTLPPWIEHQDRAILDDLMDPRLAQQVLLPIIEFPDGRIIYHDPHNPVSPLPFVLKPGATFQVPPPPPEDDPLAGQPADAGGPTPTPAPAVTPSTRPGLQP